MAFRTKIKPYAVITLDLSVPRSALAQSIITVRGTNIASWMINNLTVLSLGGGTLSVQKNTNTNDTISLSAAYHEEGNPIVELFWTNTAQPGVTATIYISWVDEG